ncbi:MAG TPA: FAD-binding oxidoreductase [Mycobacteriales bacterium]|nr:FAD-binding oxidoreductase [Mycobacteriales bacterium]
MTGLDRRELLGAVAGAGLLAACTRSAGSGPGAPSSSLSSGRSGVPSPPRLVPAQPAQPPGPPDWAALARGLAGPLLRPGQGGYDGARRLFDPRYDAIRPAAVAVVASAADVAECVRFAARYRVPITTRSGGHSYAGWSTGTGLVVNLSRLSSVASSGRVGAGAALIDVYAGLAGAGRGLPGGSCPTVGIAGLTLGGGIGVVARAYGLTCDNLLGAEVVTADGRVRTVDAGHDPDLFWALRGGGGGNVGIVTSFRFRTRAVGPVVHRFVRWPSARAAAVIPAWLAWVTGAPDALWSNLHLDVSPGGVPSVRATVTYLGDAASADRLVDRLAGMAGPFSSRSGGTLSWLDTMKLMAGCSGEPVAVCRQYRRQGFAAISDVVSRPLPAAGARALVAGAQRFAAGGGALSVIMDGLRGAVGRVGRADTAFWHRDALCTVQYYTSLPAGAPRSTVDSRYAGLRALRAAMAPYTSGGAYVNYLDPGLRGWQQAYYGGNYPRLQRIKAAYDPTRLFDFPQAIR